MLKLVFEKYEIDIIEHTQPTMHLGLVDIPAFEIPEL